MASTPELEAHDSRSGLRRAAKEDMMHDNALNARERRTSKVSGLTWTCTGSRSRSFEPNPSG